MVYVLVAMIGAGMDIFPLYPPLHPQHTHTETKVGKELTQILILFKTALTQMCHVSAVYIWVKRIDLIMIKFHDIPSKYLSYNGHLGQVEFQKLNKIFSLSQ